MMKVCKFTFIIYVGIFLIYRVETATYMEATNLHTTLTSGYNKNVRPKTDQTQTTEISVTFTLKSITGLDEVNGVLTTVCSLRMEWIDENLLWDPSAHGNIIGLKIEENLIWIPEFITSNPAKNVEKLGMPSVETDVYANGLVHYSFGEYTSYFFH